jgi:predicted Zn finger-like uncharacterized protein
MPIRVTCPECRGALSVQDAVRGKKIRCPKCQHVFVAAPAAPAKGTPPPAARTAAKSSPARPRSAAPKKSGAPWVIISVVVVLLVAGGAVGAFFLLKKSDDSNTPAPGSGTIAKGKEKDKDKEQAKKDREPEAKGDGKEPNPKGDGKEPNPKGDGKEANPKDKGSSDGAAKVDSGDKEKGKQKPDPGPDQGLKKLDPPAYARKQLEVIRTSKEPGKVQIALGRLSRTPPVDELRKEVFKVLVEQCAGPDVIAGAAAGYGLRTWSAPGLMDARQVIPLLEHKHINVRSGALLALGRLKDEQGIEPIAGHLGKLATAGFARTALRAFGPKAEKAVLARLPSGPKISLKERHMAREGVRLLRDFGTAQSVPALTTLAANKDAWLSRKATAAIKAIKDREAGVKPPAFTKPWPPVAAGPLPDALAKEIAIIQDDPAGRPLALQRLARMKLVDEHRGEIIQVLLEQADGPDDLVSGYGAQALATWVAPGVMPLEPLLDLIDHDKAGVRSGAIDALVRMKDERAVEPIADCLFSLFTRSHAVWALRQFGPKAEKTVLSFAVPSKKVTLKEMDIAQEAVRLLKHVGTAQSLPALEPLTRSDDRWLALKATNAVKAIKDREAGVKPPAFGKPWPPPASAKPLPEGLARALAAISRWQLPATQKKGFEALEKMPPDDEHRGTVVAALFDIIDGPDSDRAGAAARALPNWLVPGAMPADLLLDLLDHENGQVRLGAVAGLARLQDERAVEPIAGLMWAHFAEASRALRAFGSKAEKALLPLLKHKDGTVVREATRLLKYTGTASSVAVLEPLARSNDIWLARKAANAIKAIKDREAGIKPPAFGKPWPPPPSKALPAELAAEIGALRSGNQTSAVLACQRLAQMKPSDEHRAEMAAALLEAISGPDPAVAGPAANALPRWVTPGLMPTDLLLDLLDHENGTVRTGAILALGKLQDERAVEPLAQCLPYDFVAARVAVQSFGPKAEKALQPLLTHKNGMVARTAARLLRLYGSPESLPALEPLTRAGDRMLAEIADNAVRQIKERQAGVKPPPGKPWPPPRPEALPPAVAKEVETIGVPNSPNQTAALGRLGKMPPDEASRPFILHLILEHMDGPDTQVMNLAGGALLPWVAPGAMPAWPLTDLLDHEDSLIRVTAIKGLGRLKDESAAPLLARRLPFEFQETGKALEAIGSKVEPAVLPYLKHKLSHVVREAARVLGAVGTKESVPELQMLTKSRDRSIAQAATAALKAIEVRAK